MDLPLLDGDTFEASRAKLAALDKADKERVEKETALNELQSFNFDLGDKIYQEDHEAASTEVEREAIQAEVSKVSDWLDEEAGIDTTLEEFTSRLKALKDLAAPIFARVREHRERPEMLENLKQSLNHSNTFLLASREKNEKAAEEEKLFKEKELEQLEKKIAEVEKWRDEKLADQSSTPLSEMPKLTVSMINSKIGDLESEVQYLIRKAKMKKAELERAKLKAEADAAKAEADKKKAEKKAAKKKAKEAKEGRRRRRQVMERGRLSHQPKLHLQEMVNLSKILLKRNQNLKPRVLRSQLQGRRRENLLTRKRTRKKMMLKSMLSCDNTYTY